jgi:hypothetical protein
MRHGFAVSTSARPNLPSMMCDVALALVQNVPMTSRTRIVTWHFMILLALLG